MDPPYSIVIPAYNERARIGATLEKVLSFVHSQGWDAEVIVVNDGSRDNTAAIVQSFAAKDPAPGLKMLGEARGLENGVHRVKMNTLLRPKDGFGWGTKKGEVVD